LRDDKSISPPGTGDDGAANAKGREFLYG